LLDSYKNKSHKYGRPARRFEQGGGVYGKSEWKAV
jgi:hypothetical protein